LSFMSSCCFPVSPPCYSMQRYIMQSENHVLTSFLSWWRRQSRQWKLILLERMFMGEGFLNQIKAESSSNCELTIELEEV
jgi:hypothetical protein